MTPQYGRRLMVSAIEELAQHQPERVFAFIPSSADLQDGFREVTFKEIKVAIDYAVKWLQDGFGAFSLHETVSYIGLPDLRYNIFFYAAMKLRLKVFLPSPRNPASTNISLFEQTRCTKLTYTSEVTPVVQALQETASSLRCLVFPSLDELLAAQSIPVHYSFDFNQVRREPILILHSSGSTGIPKPIVMTHGSFAAVDNDRNFPTIPGRNNHDLTTWEIRQRCRLYVLFPPFHLAGFFNIVMLPAYTDAIPVFGPATRPPSAGLVAQILRRLDVQACFLPPTIAAGLFNEPGGPDLLKKLDLLCYAGGPLPEVIGNELIKHVALCQYYGSTEVGQVRQLFPRKEFWQYMEFHPLGKIEFQQAEDDAFELVVYASEETEDSLVLNHNLPGVCEFRTKDLFRPHPTEPNLWKFHARRDDMTVLSTGEKFNPIPLELSVETIPGIAGAIVAGQSQPRVALIVELQPDHELGADPVESIWPFIEKINMKTATPGRISKSMILIAKPEKPFIRAAKGTIVRKLTLAAYEAELNALFEGTSSRRPQSKILNPTVFRQEDVKSLVHSIIEDVMDGRSVDDAESLYIQGLDSVKSLEVVSQLREILRAHQGEKSLNWLTPEVIFSHPSIDGLAALVLDWLNNGIYPEPVDRTAKMKEMFSEYEKSLPTGSIASQSFNDNFQKTLNVFIIGSTGFLGQYLLTSLSKDPLIGPIVCLNRSATAHQRWASYLSEIQASTIEDETRDRITFIQIDFTKPRFGLQENVNFVLPIDAFKESLNGLLSSIELAASSKKRPQLLFISSISSAGIFGQPGSSHQKLVPEDVINNPDEAMHNGYAESKHVAEHLIRSACAKSGVAASVLRLGQIAPSSVSTHKIIWPPSDALTAVLTTTRSAQMVPTDLLDINWLPVDVISDLIQLIMHHDRPLAGTTEAQFYNLVNPISTPWSEAVPVVKDWCRDSTVVTGTLKEWIEAVRRQSQNLSSNQQAYPALPLLDFFKLLSEIGPEHKYSQENLQKVSGATIPIKPIDAEQLSIWLAAFP